MIGAHHAAALRQPQPQFEFDSGRAGVADLDAIERH